MKREAGDPRRALAYLRVSTDDQALGLEAQRSAIERWAKLAGVDVVQWYTDDGVSGGAALEDRPQLLAALTDLHMHRAGVFVVARRDRLARDVAVSLAVEQLVLKRGAKIQAADGAGNGDSPEARLMRVMLDAFAEYERAVIRLRIVAAMRAKKARGERVGTVPYGSEVGPDGRLRPSLSEGPVVTLIHELRLAGESHRAIVAELNKLRKPCRGKRWHLRSVQRILEAR